MPLKLPFSFPLWVFLLFPMVFHETIVVRNWFARGCSRVIEGHWLLGNLLAWRSCCGCGGRFVWFGMRNRNGSSCCYVVCGGWFCVVVDLSGELFDEGERLWCGVSPYLSDSSFSSMEILKRRHTHSYHHNKQVVDNVIVSCTPKAQEVNTKCLNNGGSWIMTPELHQNMYKYVLFFMHQEEHTGSLRSQESLDSIS